MSIGENISGVGTKHAAQLVVFVVRTGFFIDKCTETYAEVDLGLWIFLKKVVIVVVRERAGIVTSTI